MTSKHYKQQLSRRSQAASPSENLAFKTGRVFNYLEEAFTDPECLALFDAKALQEIPSFAESFLRENKFANNFYTNIAGEEMLLNALVEKANIDGLAFTAKSNIAITAGASNAFSSICYALCDQGDVILAISPTYILFANAVRAFGAELKLVPSKRDGNKFKVEAEILEAEIKNVQAAGKNIKAILIINPTNIDGQCWSEQEVQSLAEVINKHDLLVIEDRVYDGLDYDVSFAPAFFATNQLTRNRTITIDSVSKKYGATQWRIGWIYGPEEIVESVKQYVVQSIWSPSAAFQKASAVIIKASNDLQAGIKNKLSEQFKAYQDKVKENYRLRRDLAVYLVNGSELYSANKRVIAFEKLAKNFPFLKKPELMNLKPIFGVKTPIIPEAAMFILLNFESSLFANLADAVAEVDMHFARLLYKKTQVCMLPHSELTLPEGEIFFRMEVGVELDVLVESLLRLREFVANWNTFSRDSKIQELKSISPNALSEQIDFNNIPKSTYLN